MSNLLINALNHKGKRKLTTNELILEVISLPVEQRLLLTESLLESLNPPDKDIDAQWIQVANSRLGDLRSGKVNAISGSDVFAKVKGMFS
jgi:hypothetical protein